MARDAEQAARLADQARQAQRSGDMVQALQLWQQAYLLNAVSEAIAWEYASLLLANIHESDPDLARRVLRHTFGEQPKSPEARRLTARAAFRNHEHDVAADLAKSLLEAPSGDPSIQAEASYILGVIAEDVDPAAALEHFRTASRLFPASPLYHVRMGYAHEGLEQLEPATLAYRRAIELQPAELEAHFRLAHVLRNRGQDDAAENERQIHYWLNRSVDNAANTEAAIEQRMEAFEQLATRLPQYIVGRLQLIEFRISHGDHAAAEQHARKLIEWQPELERSYGLYTEALRRGRGDASAREQLEQLLTDVAAVPVAIRGQILKVVLEGFPQ